MLLKCDIEGTVWGQIWSQSLELLRKKQKYLSGISVNKGQLNYDLLSAN